MSIKEKYFHENVVYQIYPRSYKDANGDGVGDIKGIISKLDYLKLLGIGIIWLSPVYESPHDDMGYDVSNYYKIHKEYGTLEEMELLISEAKKRDIRIIMDLVVNHTSDEHEWFIKSKDVNSKYHDYYIWRKGRKNNTRPPNNWQSNFSGSAWKYDKDVDKWYLHLFSEKQVDLNFHNKEVIEEVKKIIKFWMDKGIYGFRCDVINQIYKTSLDNGRQRIFLTGREHYLNQEGNHLILKELQRDVFSKYDSMTVGETFRVDFKNANKFLDDELDMVFQFDHVNVDRFSVPLFKKKYRPRKLKKILFNWQQNVSWNTNYLENHDQLRSIPRFGDEKNYYLESAKMLAMLTLLLKGTPFIYQGQEIGMLNIGTDNLEDIKDVAAVTVYNLLRKLLIPHRLALKLVNTINRDNARTPMQWDKTNHAGFTTGDPWLKVNPNYQDINVENNLKDPNSLFYFYQKLIKLRKEIKALSYGNFNALSTSGNLIAFTRTFGEDEYTVILNLTNKKRKNPLFLRGEVILSNYDETNYEDKKYLAPYEGALIKTS
ncbi:MAG: alpha-glucosidase [Bacilli bacterium]